MSAIRSRGPLHGACDREGRPWIPLDQEDPGLFPPYDRDCYSCSQCGAVFWANAEYMDPEYRAGWLVHPERDITRCPRHLNRYQLERAGIQARRHEVRVWMERIIQSDMGQMHIDPTAMPWRLSNMVWEGCFGEKHPLSESD